MNTPQNGFVIAIDGPDGVGKTTQVELLADYLRHKSHNVHMARHNGGTPIGEALRKVSLSPTERSAKTDFFISLAMGQALSEDIAKRKQQEIILIDRSPLAIIAYQAYGGQLDDRQMVLQAAAKLFHDEQVDLLLFLDAPQAVLDERRQKRQINDYFEQQDAAFHARVREGYSAGLEFLKKQPGFNAKVVVIDASGSIDAINKAIVNAVHQAEL